MVDTAQWSTRPGSAPVTEPARVAKTALEVPDESSMLRVNCLIMAVSGKMVLNALPMPRTTNPVPVSAARS
jgi:hypothetical protein